MTVEQERLPLEPAIELAEVLDAERGVFGWTTHFVRSIPHTVYGYYLNFISARFVVYQFVGGVGSVGIKLLLPQIGILDNTEYMGALYLQFAGSGGHFMLQFPAYVYFEHRDYGQSYASVIREYFAWRIPELLLSPGRYFDAFQANSTDGFLGDSLGAAATSLPISLGHGVNMLTAPITQGVYRRLQIRKEHGYPAGAWEVWHIAHNGLINFAGFLLRTRRNLVDRLR